VGVVDSSPVIIPGKAWKKVSAVTTTGGREQLVGIGITTSAVLVTAVASSLFSVGSIGTAPPSLSVPSSRRLTTTVSEVTAGTTTGGATTLLSSVSVAVSATLVFVGEEGVVLAIVEAITTRQYCENGKLRDYSEMPSGVIQ
jgi:hypothetical protein